MKKLQKIALVVLIISTIYLTTFNSYASGFGDIWETGKNFLNTGSTGSGMDKINSETINDSIKELVDFLWGFGLLIVFASTIILGIKYMLVLPNERSRIKQATTPWILGVVIIFGAVTIWKLVIAILEDSMGIGG